MVQGASKTFVMKTHKWSFETMATKGFFDEKMRNNLLIDPPVVKREHIKFPRSDVGFKTLGSLDYWRCIDGIGKVGSVRDTFQLSLLRHKQNGILLELLHFSPGFFCFQAVAGGPILCCLEDGRVKERSDLAHKGDCKGPLWKFHSPKTVAEYVTREGLGLKERYAQLTSSVPGRWLVGISVPHVFIANHSESALQIVLTSHGFVVLGGGPDPQGLIVERGQIRSLSVQDAIDYVRHQPAKPDDVTELDNLSRRQKKWRTGSMAELHTSMPSLSVSHGDSSLLETSAHTLSTVGDGESKNQGADVVGSPSTPSKEIVDGVLDAERRMLKLDLEKSFDTEGRFQKSYEEMVINDGFRECCSLLKRLHGHLSLGEILDASDRINRRAQLVRVCGDYGKEWVPGTGTTTQFAFLVDEIREKIAKQSLNAIFVHFFRMEYHHPHEVIAHLVRQLGANVPGYEDVLNGTVLKALSSYSHAQMANVMYELCMYHMQKDRAVIIIVDNLHLAEQRILGYMAYELRRSLQPWFYNLKRQGYVRIVFSGRDGYSAPSGAPVATMQLHRLSEPGARKVLTKMLSVRKKHVSLHLVDVLLQKQDACRMQYLRVATIIVQRYWVFEQNNSYIEALPEDLLGLYGLSIRNLEQDFGESMVETMLLLLIGKDAVLTFEEMQTRLTDDRPSGTQSSYC